MNHATIEQLLESCTVRIKIKGVRIGHGTGFFIAPGYVVTCAHVVLRHSLNSEVILSTKDSNQYLPAKIVHSFEPTLDLVILQIIPKFAHSCVYISQEINVRDPCFSFGYTDSEYGNPDGDPITLECEGLAGRQRSFIKLKGGQIRPGMSGAPLLNQRTGKVCGVITKTRDRRFDLGGIALPVATIFQDFPALKKVHDDFHLAHSDWSKYLQESIEPYPSDWNRLNRTRERWVLYLRALWFLVSVLFKWIVLGLKAPRAFPIEAINLLIQHTFSGDLGQEIQKQRKQLFRHLSKVDFESGNQARIINQLESKASVLSELITILIPESQNLASSSRLLWAAELIYEQQDLLNELKKIEGNSYLELEKWKRRFGFLKVSPDKRYREVDRVINRLLWRHSGYDSGTLSFRITLEDSIELITRNLKAGLFVVNRVLDYLHAPISKAERADFDRESNEENDYATLVKSVLEDLEDDIKNNPHLQVLGKTKILLENVAGKPITGGPYRAWGKSKSKNKYHFSRKCKFYPERARPHEMNKISCYDSHEEASKHHEPCKTCMTAENLRSMDFVGDESS